MEQKRVISNDGTLISYAKTGSGDGLIIVHGGARMASDYQKLAETLADKYTVYTYDRRGRGASGKITADHSIDKECEDLAAMMKETGASNIFGHSMGAIITLETAVRFPVRNIAVYEPPVPVNNSLPVEFLKDFSTALEQKKYEKAMVVMMKGLKVHDMAKLPSWLLTGILKLIQVLNKEKGKEWGERMAEVLPTLITDIDAIRPLNNTYGKYEKIRAATFLMGGSKSPAYLLQPIELLSGIIPLSSAQVFKGYYHDAPNENTEVIANSLKDFFK